MIHRFIFSFVYNNTYLTLMIKVPVKWRVMGVSKEQTNMTRFTHSPTYSFTHTQPLNLQLSFIANHLSFQHPPAGSTHGFSGLVAPLVQCPCSCDRDAMQPAVVWAAAFQGGVVMLDTSVFTVFAFVCEIMFLAFPLISSHCYKVTWSMRQNVHLNI